MSRFLGYIHYGELKHSIYLEDTETGPKSILIPYKNKECIFPICIAFSNDSGGGTLYKTQSNLLPAEGDTITIDENITWETIRGFDPNESTTLCVAKMIPDHNLKIEFQVSDD